MRCYASVKIMEHKTYTQEEINRNIETLTNKMDNLKLERTELTKNINSIKKTDRGMVKVRQKPIKNV